MEEKNIIYQIINLTNNDPAPVLAKVTDTRDGAILDKPGDWECSVIRMQISTREIPLFTPEQPIAPGQTDMSITLQYMNINFRQFILVTPQESKKVLFSIQNYLEELNDASIAAFTALKAAFPGASGTEAPRFYLNPSTALISMYVQDVYLEANPNRIQIGINQVLMQLLNLPFTQSFPIPAPGGFEFLLSVKPYATLLPVPPRTGFPVALSALGGNWIAVSQGFSSTDEWDNVKSIIFVSNLLPITRNLLPNLVSQAQNQTINNSSMGILIDFELQKSSPFEPRHIAQFAVQSEFKMISMNGNTPFNRVDVQAYYQTYDGRLFEIYLGNNTNMSLLIMYRRKDKK